MLQLRLAWRNLWRNKRRTFITIAAVFFAGFSIISMRSLQTGAYGSMVRTMVGSHTGFIQVHQKGYWDEKFIDNSFEERPELREEISSVPGVTGVSPRLTSHSLIAFEDRSRPAIVDGIDAEYEAQLDIESNLIAGDSKPGDGVLIGQGMAKFLNVEVGDSVVFLGSGYHGMSANALLPVRGIVRFTSPVLNDNTAFIDLQMAQYVFAASGMLTAYAINTDPNADLDAVLSDVTQVVQDTSVYEVMGWHEMMPELVQSIEADSAGGILMAGILYIVISFSLLGTFIMLAAERKREYGMLIGLGMRRGQLMRIAFIEASAMAVMGAALAVLITRPLTLYYHYNPIQFTGQAMEALREMGMDPVMPASIDWSIPLTHGMILIFLTLSISLYAMISIKRIQPVNAMRS